MLKELEKINLENKGQYINLFGNLLNKLQRNQKFTYEFNKSILIKEEIKGENLVTIVPRELKELFYKMRKKYPDEFLGFSILVNNKRINCFGILYSELGKVIIK